MRRSRRRGVRHPVADAIARGNRPANAACAHAAGPHLVSAGAPARRRSPAASGRRERFCHPRGRPASGGIERCDLGRKPQIDRGGGVEIHPAQRPIFRRAAGECPLRQVGPIDRSRGLVLNAAAHRDDLPPQHLGGGKAGSATADDDDLAGHHQPRALHAPELLRFCRTKIRSPLCSTFHTESGLSASARAASRCADRNRRDARDSGYTRRHEPSASGP